MHCIFCGDIFFIYFSATTVEDLEMELELQETWALMKLPSSLQPSLDTPPQGIRQKGESLAGGVEGAG